MGAFPPNLVAVQLNGPLTRGTPPCPSPGSPSREVLSHLDIPAGLGYQLGAAGRGARGAGDGDRGTDGGAARDPGGG